MRTLARCIAISAFVLGAVHAGIIVDGLNGLDPSTLVPQGGTGGLVIESNSLVGPEFTLSTTTLITQIGAFQDSSCANSVLGVTCSNVYPFLVQVVGVNGSGLPDLTNVFGTYEVPMNPDPAYFVYESVDPNLVLFPGTYFALFEAQSADVGSLMSNSFCQSTGNCTEGPPGIYHYIAAPVNLGVVDVPLEYVYSDYASAVRVLGNAVPEASSFTLVVTALAGIGILQMVKRRVP